MEALPGRAGAAAPARRSSRAGRRWARSLRGLSSASPTEAGERGLEQEPLAGSAPVLQEGGKGGRQHKSLIPDIRVHTPGPPFLSASPRRTETHIPAAKPAGRPGRARSRLPGAGAALRRRPEPE